ncbi:SH3 domain-containing protein [Thermodesulfobacteriota bacterium]
MKRVLAAVALLVLWTGLAAAERLAVSVDIANVRSGPGQNHDTIWKVEKYHPIDVVERSGQWCRFRDFEGDEGWIHASLLREMDTVITTRKANVRSGPGTTNQVILTSESGVAFKVLKKKGKWLQVEHGDGERGWIYSSLVW